MATNHKAILPHQGTIHYNGTGIQLDIVALSHNTFEGHLITIQYNGTKLQNNIMAPNYKTYNGTKLLNNEIQLQQIIKHNNVTKIKTLRYGS